MRLLIVYLILSLFNSQSLFAKEGATENFQRVVFITGASKGIGLEIAKHLACEGYLVYAGHRKNSKMGPLNKAEKLYKKNLTPICVDVTDSSSIEKATLQIIREAKRIDVLINNACKAMIGTCETTTIEEQREVMNVNYFGAVRMLQAVLPYMRKQRMGHVINMSSVCGFEPFPVVESYVASKFALEGLSESLSIYLNHWNIHVTLIEPAGVKTSLSFTSLMGSRFTKETNCYKKMCKEGQRLMRDNYANSQDPKEISQLVGRILREPKPHLRYQTNAISENMAKSRFIDPTGDSPLVIKRFKQQKLTDLLPEDF